MDLKAAEHSAKWIQIYYQTLNQYFKKYNFYTALFFSNVRDLDKWDFKDKADDILLFSICC